MRTYLATLHVGVHGFAQERTVECGRVLVRSRSDAKRILRGPICATSQRGQGPVGQRFGANAAPATGAINRASCRPSHEAKAMPQTAPWLPGKCPRRRVGCA